MVVPLPCSLLAHRHSDHFFSFYSLTQPQRKKNLFLNIQPTRVPQKTQSPTQHAHGIDFRVSQVRYQCMHQGNPPNYHAPQSLCRFIHDFIFSHQNTFIKGSWRQLGRVQNGMLWLEQASLITRLFSLEALAHMSHRFTGSEVSLHVKGKMIRPGETPVTMRALERLCPSVLSEVPC